MSENVSMSRGSSNGSSNGNGGGNSKRRLADYFVQNKCGVDYKDAEVLRRFISPEGKILPSRRSGLIACNQRKVTKAIKRARSAGLLPFSTFES